MSSIKLKKKNDISLNTRYHSYNKLITNRIISKKHRLKYIICLMCCNRKELNAINTIEETIDGFLKANIFRGEFDYDFYIFDTGSTTINYMKNINNKLLKNNIKYKIFTNKTRLSGEFNLINVFRFITKHKLLYDFAILLEDDIYCCNHLIKNIDIFLKRFGNFALLHTFYTPFESNDTNLNYLRYSNISTFFGTCCCAFKPELLTHVLKHWKYNNKPPDMKFREAIHEAFPPAKYVFCSYPSLVQHMRDGSAIFKHSKKTGHQTDTFIGPNKDPMFEYKIK